MAMVLRLCVTMINCVVSKKGFTTVKNLSVLASSSGASTSSKTQKGEGLTENSENSKAKAVSAFSPPDNNEICCGFFPGGLAIMSKPDSNGFVSSIKTKSADPPLNNVL